MPLPLSSKFGFGTGLRTPGGTSDFGSTMGQISKEYEEALKENEKRYAQAMAIYDEIINRYQPGGQFGKAALGQLEAQKERDVGKETQGLISSGLYGTTGMAGLGTKWEAEVGAPARLKLEDIMMERLSQAQVGKAGFIERREDEYPDVGAAAGYAAQAAAAGGGGGGRGGGMTISGTTGATQRWGTYGAGTPSGAGGIGGGRTTGPGPGVASATRHVGPAHQQPTPGYGLADAEALKTARGPGGVSLAGQRTSYTAEQSAWMKSQAAAYRKATGG